MPVANTSASYLGAGQIGDPPRGIPAFGAQVCVCLCHPVSFTSLNCQSACIDYSSFLVSFGFFRLSLSRALPVVSHERGDLGIDVAPLTRVTISKLWGFVAAAWRDGVLFWHLRGHHPGHDCGPARSRGAHGRSGQRPGRPCL